MSESTLTAPVEFVPDKPTLADVPRFAAMLRSAGVSRFSGFGLEIELFPVGRPVSPDAADKAPAEDDGNCPCGHPREHHNSAGCDEGCHPLKCMGMKAKTEEAP